MLKSFVEVLKSFGQYIVMGIMTSRVHELMELHCSLTWVPEHLLSAAEVSLYPGCPCIDVKQCIAEKVRHVQEKKIGPKKVFKSSWIAEICTQNEFEEILIWRFFGPVHVKVSLQHCPGRPCSPKSMSLSPGCHCI